MKRILLKSSAKQLRMENWKGGQAFEVGDGLQNGYKGNRSRADATESGAVDNPSEIVRIS